MLSISKRLAVQTSERPMTDPSKLDPVMRKLREMQLMPAIAVKLNLKRQTPYQWRRVPAEYVLTVADLSGLDPHEIRPDLYPVPFWQAANAS